MKQSKEVVPVRRRRKTVQEQELFAALRQFDDAGNISVKEFAAAFQISEATYYNWRKRYQAKNSIPVDGFIEVDLSVLRKEEGRGEIFAEFRASFFIKGSIRLILKHYC